MRILVLEGGGMRGVYTSGVLEALAEAEAGFSHIVACSAGACAAASFLAGQPERNRRVYLEHLSGSQLVDFRRLLVGGNVMDIDYLASEVTLTLDPLDLERLRSASESLHIGVTEWRSGASCYFVSREQESSNDLVTLLKATCALPLFYRGRVFFRGTRYVDGGVSDPVPVQKALSIDGATDVVVVLTSSIEERGEPMSPLLVRLFSSSAGVQKALRERHLRYRRAAELLRAPPKGARIHVIRPSRPLDVRRTTTQRQKLEAGCDLGYEDGKRFAASFER